MYDRETGKPKGYGFCEYQDQETALSAMRNLNGREFSGRALRVDNAASEKNKEELKSKFLISSRVCLGKLLVIICFNTQAIFVLHRFGNRSPHYWVSLWRQHPARGGPRVHQQSSSQSATWADVWTHETNEGRVCPPPPYTLITISREEIEVSLLYSRWEVNLSIVESSAKWVVCGAFKN